MEKLKRYLVFFIGLYINSFGVAMITKAALGTSPISSIPYVLSLQFPFSLGEFTIFFSLFLILLQLLILRRNFHLEHLLQIPISILFGYFIDISMVLLNFVNPELYLMKIVYLLIGCPILGFGVYTEVLADVAMLPGESFVRAIVTVWHTEFGITKVCFDASMTIIAAVLSVIFFHQLNGVREGTIIAALLVGFIARSFGRILSFLEPKLFPAQEADSSETAPVSGIPSVITIDRQYGSGGREIGKKLAERLGYKFFDNEIIQMTAGSTGFSPDFVQKNDEAMSNRLLYDLAAQMYSYAPNTPSPKDAIFEGESKIIRALARGGNCVIMGRCADYILKDDFPCFRVFLQAPSDYRIQRIADTEHLSKDKAAAKIRQMNRKRADYYHYYTHRLWGIAGNYHLTLDTSLGTDYVLNSITHGFWQYQEMAFSNEND